MAKILQEPADQAQRQRGGPAVAISSSQLTVSPASGADLTLRNISTAPVVFSVCGAPQQVCREVFAQFSSQPSIPFPETVPSPCLHHIPACKAAFKCRGNVTPSTDRDSYLAVPSCMVSWADVWVYAGALQNTTSGGRRGCRLPGWVSVQPLSGALAPQATAKIHFSSLLSERSKEALTVRRNDDVCLVSSTEPVQACQSLYVSRARGTAMSWSALVRPCSVLLSLLVPCCGRVR